MAPKRNALVLTLGGTSRFDYGPDNKAGMRCGTYRVPCHCSQGCVDAAPLAWRPAPAGGATDVMARGMAQRVSSKTRMAALPQVPTIAESGVKGYEVSNWLGLFAPAGTPRDVLATLHAALGRTMANPALGKQLAALGIEPTFGTPEELSALTRAELPKWAGIVKKSGASAE